VRRAAQRINPDAATIEDNPGRHTALLSVADRAAYSGCRVRSATVFDPFRQERGRAV